MKEIQIQVMSGSRFSNGDKIIPETRQRKCTKGTAKKAKTKTKNNLNVTLGGTGY